MSNFKKNTIINPIIVLVCIGLVASFLLAAVYQVTKPIIDEREAQTKNDALKLVLPEATSFTKLEDEELITGVTEIYKADNGAGYVCSTNCKSQQGGEISMMVGINSMNQVNGISVIKHNETAGIGDKVLQESYFKNYYGIADVDEIDAVDAVSGATKTSNCVKESAKVAVTMVSQISDIVLPDTDKTYEEKLVIALNNAFENMNTSKIDADLIENVKEIYKASDEAGYAVVVEKGGVITLVAVNKDLEVLSTSFLESEANETELEEICKIAIEQVQKIK